MSENLTIRIVGDSESALGALRAVQAELKQLVTLAAQANKAMKGGFTLGGAATVGDELEKTLVQPIENAEKAAKKAKKSLQDTLSSLMGGYSVAAASGHSHNREDFIKKIERTLSAMSVDALKEVDPGKLKAQLDDIEKQRQQFFERTRKYGVGQSSAGDMDQKRGYAQQLEAAEDYHREHKRGIEERLRLDEAVRENNKKIRREQEAYGTSFSAQRKRELSDIFTHTGAIKANDDKILAEQVKFGDEYNEHRRRWIQGSLDASAASNTNNSLKSAEQLRLGQEMVDDIDRRKDKEREYVIAQKLNEKAIADAVRSSSVTVRKEYAEIAKAMGSAWQIQPGMSDARIKFIEKDLKKVLDLKGKIEHELAQNPDAKIKRASGTQLHNDSQGSIWGGSAKKKPKDIMLGPTEWGTLIQHMDAFDSKVQGLIVKQGPLKSMIADVTSFMSLQARWFASAALVFAIPTMIYGATKAYLEFEKAIKDIGGVTGATAEEMKILSDEALRVSSIVPQSAGELAKMSRIFVQAGFGVNEAKMTMETLAKVATLSGESTETIVKTFASVMHIWKINASEAEKVGNVLAAALNYSALQIEDIGTALNYAGSSFAQFGISVTEASALLASFSSHGLHASTIGTSLSRLVTEVISQPPKKFLDFMGDDYEKFVRVFESDSPTKFADGIALLEKKGMTASKAFSIFNLLTGRAMNAALNIGSESLKKMYTDIDTTTQLTEGFNTVMDSSANKLLVMKNRAQDLAIVFISTLKPVFDTIIVAMGHFLNFISTIITGFDAVGGKAIAAGMVLVGLSSLVIKTAAAYIAAQKAATGLAFAMLFLSKIPIWGWAGLAATGILFLIGLFNKGKKSTTDYVSVLQESSKRAELAVAGLGNGVDENGKVLDRGEAMVRRYSLALQEIDGSSFNMSPALEDDFKKLEGLWDATQKAHTDAVDKITGNMDKLIAKQKEMDDKAKNSGFVYQIKLLYSILSRDRTNALKAVAESGGEGATDIVKGVFPEFFGDKGAELEAANLRKKIEEAQAQIKAEDDALKAAQNAEYYKGYLAKKESTYSEVALQAIPGDKVSQIKKGFADVKAAYDVAYEDLFKDLAKNGERGDTVVDALATLNKKFGKELTAENGQVWSYLEDAKRLNKQSIDEGWIDPIEKIEAQYKEKTGIIKAYIDGLGSILDDANIKLDPKTRKTIAGVLAGLQDTNVRETGAGEFKVGQEFSKYVIEAAGIQKDLDLEKIAREENLLALKKQLHLVNPVEAMKEEARLADRRLVSEIEVLKLQQQRAKIDADMTGDFTQYNKIVAQAAGLEAKRVDPVEKLRKEYEAVNRALDESISKMDTYSEFTGMDFSREKRLAEDSQKLGGLSEKDRKEVEDVWNRIHMIGTGAQSLGDDFTGMWDAFMIGAGRGAAGWKDFTGQLLSLGQSTIQSLQGSASDFFFNLSTGAGYNEQDSFWEYLKDQADDFLKSLWQSFSRTISNMMSEWMMSGLLDMIKKFAQSKGLMQAQDASAAAAQQALTAAFMSQTGAVITLTNAFWALGIAKKFAGIGGGMSGETGGGTVGGESFTGQSWAQPSMIGHKGGFIFHDGGLVPRFHSGGLSPDERLAILQTNEYVISRKGVKAAGLGTLNAINSGKMPVAEGESGGGTTNNYFITANDAKSFVDMCKRNPGAITGTVNRDLRMAGSTRSSMRTYL